MRCSSFARHFDLKTSAARNLSAFDVTDLYFLLAPTIATEQPHRTTIIRHARKVQRNQAPVAFASFHLGKIPTCGQKRNVPSPSNPVPSEQPPREDEPMKATDTAPTPKNAPSGPSGRKCSRQFLCFARQGSVPDRDGMANPARSQRNRRGGDGRNGPLPRRVRG